MRRFIAKIVEKAKQDPKKIVFPESSEERNLRAIEIILKQGFAVPILLGKPDEINARIKELGLDIKDVEIIDYENSDKFEKYSEELYNLRKHKGLSLDQAKGILKDAIYFGTMMVHLGEADGLISGAVHSTAHTIRPALQIIKTKEMFHKVSGAFFMIFKDQYMLFADAAVTISPDAKDLAKIAIDSAETAKRFGIEPKVAMLSFSTKGSAKHPLVDKVIEATKIVQHERPDIVADGEMQLDAAIEPEVCKIKCPDCKLQGQANVLIFPDLQAANIGYKLATFFGNADAVGPVLQGLNKPINDLSRGCKVQEIVDIAAITVVQAQNIEKK